MKLWTIYERPLDYPEGYVLREWMILRGANLAPGPATRHATLAQARDAMPPGLFRLPRKETDGPHILETWI